jgi:uncharacterized membrane protein (DUF106 family)
MEPIKALFNEVKLEMLKIALIYSFLDSIMVFFIVYFVVSFFNIKFLYALLIPAVITAIFFAVNLVTRINKLRLKTMEDANPQVKEMLRTAHDNMGEENLMMIALFEELKGKMKTVSSGNLLESKRIIIRIVSAVIIVFLIIFVSAFDVNLKKIDIPFAKLRFMAGNNNAYGEGNITDLVFNETDVVYGDASIAKLGNEKIDLNVNPTMSDIDFNKVSDAEKDNLREGEVPSEVAVILMLLTTSRCWMRLSRLLITARE